MSSSAPRMQPAPGSCAEAQPFNYPEAQAEGGEGAGSRPTHGSEELARQREAEMFERGRQAAQQQLQSALDAAVARAREQVEGAIRDFARERASYYRRVEGEVVQLALAIARKVLHREVQIDPHALAGIVRITLDKLDAGTKADLHVHPSEATDWRHYFANRAEGVIPEVHEDPSLPAGECRIATSLGSTEIGIASQLKEIETGLLDLLAERPVNVPPPSAASEPPR